MSHSTLLSHLLTSVAVMAFTVAGVLAGSGEALATPTGGVQTAGTGTITNPTSTQTLITQTSQKGVYTWTGYNTSAGQTVQYAQPTPTAIALNIISGGKTTFNGSLLANGGVWLINPDGMLFGGATVNVGSLLLSTADITNPTGSGFYTNNTGHYVFDQAGTPAANITLDNTMVTTSGDGTGNNGDIIIMAPSIAVQNNSNVHTGSGTVELLGGETFTADFNGDGLINYQVLGPNITSPVSALAPGATDVIYVGTGSTISTSPNTNNRIVMATSVAQDVVLDNAINLGGQAAYQYTGYANPEGIHLSNFMWASATVSPTPPPTPTPTPTPVTSIPTPPATAPVVTAAVTPTTQNIIILPLTRPLEALGDETVNDTTVNPAVANVTYARPYLVSLNDSIADGKLTLSSGSNSPAGGSPTNLGNLSPAAGGDTSDNAQDNLGDLSPSAGGPITSAPSGISTANAYLDNGGSALQEVLAPK